MSFSKVQAVLADVDPMRARNQRMQLRWARESDLISPEAMLIRERLHQLIDEKEAVLVDKKIAEWALSGTPDPTLYIDMLLKGD